MIVKMLSFVKKMPIEEIDAYIEKAEYCAEILSVLLQYKNRLYPPDVLDEMETEKFEKDFGLRDKTISDYRKIFKISKKDGFYQITGYKSTETTVIIPAEIQGIPVQIGEEAFQDQRHIETVYIENGITSIGPSAFSYCHSLQSIEIPDSVASIGQSAFWACIALQRITIPASVTEIGSGAFYLSKNVTLCAPKGSYAETYARENQIAFEAI